MRIPASHFYEWRAVGARLPIAISREDGKVLHLAGLLGRWGTQAAATILTTVPNADVAALHDRMPVVLDDEDAATWVLEDLSLEQVAKFLMPCPNGWLQLAPGSPLVNDVRNQGPELLDPGALPGPFWQKRDDGAWSIPKGEYAENETGIDVARREFQEELGMPAPDGKLTALGCGRANVNPNTSPPPRGIWPGNLEGFASSLC